MRDLYQQVGVTRYEDAFPAFEAAHQEKLRKIMSLLKSIATMVQKTQKGRGVVVVEMASREMRVGETEGDRVVLPDDLIHTFWGSHGP